VIGIEGYEILMIVVTLKLVSLVIKHTQIYINLRPKVRDSNLVVVRGVLEKGRYIIASSFFGLL